MEIHVPGHINFKWNHSNLDNGRKLGKVRCGAGNQEPTTHMQARKPHDGPHFINEKPGGPDSQRVV